jgi:hypothetical protein
MGSAKELQTGDINAGNRRDIDLDAICLLERVAEYGPQPGRIVDHQLTG